VTAVRGRIAPELRRGLPPGEAQRLQSKKDAQDAHEAIRPTYFDRDPEQIKKFLARTSTPSTS
jgi:DNA topoisomerase-1